MTELSSGQPCRSYSLADIQLATKNFDDSLVVGQGGFGKVYKGHINCEESSSTVVAIKRLDSMSDQGAPEFRAEIEMLSKLRHCHLVSLLGFCNDDKEMILIYEYMPHGTLDHHLHKTDTPLSWMQRLRISIGAARGLDYLHTGAGTQHGVIHRDVKCSNILLDENWAAKISDFGLSKIGPTNQPSTYVNTGIKGTFGYLDPEYFLTGKLTRKTDVFAFGVVLFEVLSGRQAVDESYPEEEWSLARWAQKCVREKNLDQIVSADIRGQLAPKSLKEFAQIAYRCLHSCLKERPTMAEVVVALQLSQATQEKFYSSAQRAGVMGFTRKMQKYFVFSTTDHSGTNTSKDSEDNITNYSLTKEDDRTLDQRMTKEDDEELKAFTYSELKCATRNFGYQTRLGKGKYGEVFKGWVDAETYSPSELDIGLAIAVKRIHQYKFESLEKAELDLKMLGKYRHPNLVKLLGYCLEDKTLILVYEFMQKGCLWNHLRNGKLQSILGAAAPLPLVTRVKIAVGIARGLVFLQKTQDKDSGWATVDESLLQKNNILLDEDFNAKISDFGLEMLDIDVGVDIIDDCYYYPGYRPAQRQSENGFTEVLGELLFEKPVLSGTGLWDVKIKMFMDGKDTIHSLTSISQYCLERCNDEDSEQKIPLVLNQFKSGMDGS